MQKGTLFTMDIVGKILLLPTKTNRVNCEQDSSVRASSHLPSLPFPQALSRTGNYFTADMSA